MNEKNTLWKQFQQVNSKINIKKRIIQQLIQIFQRRYDVEEYYARQIQDINNMIAKIITPKNQLSSLYQSFHQYHNIKIQQSDIFRDSISSEIITNLKNCLSRLTIAMKNYNSNFRKLQKDQQTYKQVVVKVECFYQNWLKLKTFYKQYEEGQFQMQYVNISRSFSIQKKNIKLKKFNEQENKVGQIEKTYQKSVQKYNQFLKIYKSQTIQISVNINQIINQMNKIQKDSMIKLEVYEKTYLKMQQCEIQLINAVKLYYKNFQILQKQIKPDAYEKSFSEINQFPLKYNFSNFAINRIKYFQELGNLNKNKVIKQFIQTSIRKGCVIQDESNQFPQVFILKLLIKLWKGYFRIIRQQIIQEEYTKFKQQTKAQGNLRLCLMCLQHFRICGKFEVSSKSIDSAKKLLNILLDICIEKQDCLFPRKLLLLGYTYYFLEGQNKNSDNKYFLNSIFKQHFIWKSQEFWWSAIFDSIQEELRSVINFNSSLLQIGNSTTQEIQTAQINIIFGQLSSFAHYMVLFELETKAARNLINKGIKFYNIPDSKGREIKVIMCKRMLQSRH